MSIQADALTAYAPPVVPLAAEGESPRVGDVIISCGCSEARAPFAFVGYVEDFFGKVARFYPAPKGGQSGSAVLRYYPDDGWRLVDWIAYRVGDERTQSEEQTRRRNLKRRRRRVLRRARRRANANELRRFAGETVPAAGDDAAPFDDSLGTSAVEPLEKSATLGTLNGLDADAEILSLEELARDFYAKFDAPSATEAPPIAFAIGSTDVATKPVASGTRISVLFYTTSGCVACRQAEPVAAKFQAQGRPIRSFNVSNPEGKADADRRGVLEFPTFVCYRSDDGGASWREIARFVGVSSDLETRLEQIFSLGAQGGAAGPPPSSHTGNLKRGIVFGYDRTRGSVVGPIKNRSGVAPQTLEHGGFTRDLTTPEFRIGAKAPVRWARGKRRMIYVELATERDVETAKRFWEEAGKRPAAYVRARPYMGPALDAELPRAPELWRHSVVR